MSIQSVFKNKFKIKNSITSIKNKKQKNKHISLVSPVETYLKFDTTDNVNNKHLVSEKLHLKESSKCSSNTNNNSLKEPKINKKKRKSTEKNNKAETPIKKKVTFAVDVKSDKDGEKCTAGKMKPLSLNKRKKLNYLKKLKAKKNKQKNAKKSEENTSANQTPRQERAIEYLKQWKNDRSNWKFKKIYQLWLVKNTYDTTKASILGKKKI